MRGLCNVFVPFLAEDAAFLKEALASVSVDQVDRMKVRRQRPLTLPLYIHTHTSAIYIHTSAIYTCTYFRYVYTHTSVIYIYILPLYMYILPLYIYILPLYMYILPLL